MKKSGANNESAYPGWSQLEIDGAIYREPTPGLTKRELFAMAAMQGLAASTAFPMTVPDLANVAVRTADALLAELAK